MWRETSVPPPTLPRPHTTLSCRRQPYDIQKLHCLHLHKHTYTQVTTNNIFILELKYILTLYDIYTYLFIYLMNSRDFEDHLTTYTLKCSNQIQYFFSSLSDILSS